MTKSAWSARDWRRAVLLEDEFRRRRRERAERQRALTSGPRNSLAAFLREAWPVMEPGTDLVWSWHLDAICEHLEAVTRGDIGRLIINVPPGSMKSKCVSVAWPAWEWLEQPGTRSLFSSYALELALRDSLYCRDLVTSDWYAEAFGCDWRLKKDQNVKSYFENTAGGFRLSISVGSKATGYRGHKVVVDDPINVADKLSKLTKAEVIRWWDTVMPSRVNDPRRAKFVVIMQRVAEDDLTGHLLKKGGYVHLCIPAEYDPRRRCETPLWADPRTEPGESFFPQFFTPEVLAGFRSTLGGEDYEGQYGQRPASDEGARFRREWFRYWEWVDHDLVRLVRTADRSDLVRLGHCRIFVSVDSANSERQSADYSVFSVWAVSPQCDLILLDRLRGRMSDPEAIQAAIRLQQRWGPTHFVVEENGVGLPRIANMRAKGLPVRGVRVHNDKISRSLTAVIRMEAGQIYWPPGDRAPWLAEWEHEHLLFPVSEHDDQVDTTSLAAIEVFEQGGAAPPPRPPLPERVADAPQSHSAAHRLRRRSDPR